MGLILALARPIPQDIWQSYGMHARSAGYHAKIIQTGNVDVSEDIQQHREIMGTGWLPEDESKLTMPEIFSYAASCHLATKLDGREIDFAKIEAATQQLAEKI